jgi:hypothetical protein
MSTVTSINAFPPRPPRGGGVFSSTAEGGGDPRIGAIMSVPNELIVQAIGMAASAGLAIMFSPTSDGGALGVHVWDGTERSKIYATTPEAFERVLRAVQDYAEAKMAGGPTGLPKNATRRS